MCGIFQGNGEALETSALQGNDLGCQACTEVIQICEVLLEKHVFYGILVNDFFLANLVSSLKTFVALAIRAFLSHGASLEIDFLLKVHNWVGTT